MNSKEIEDEIQARIDFKMEEFLTSLKNRLGFKKAEAYSELTDKSFYKWKAFEEVCEVMRKEIRMGPPHDEMARVRKWKAKEKAVDNIVKKLKIEGGVDSMIKQRIIADEIENSQNW